MIADWCRELAGFPESVWIAYAHSREPLRRLVTSEDYANHFHASSFCGVEMARQVRGDWGDISCRELAEKLNVTLEWPAMPEGNGLVTFACYFEPDRIQVYTDNAAATRSLRMRLALKQLKLPFMYSPILRSAVLKSGITAIHPFCTEAQAPSQKH